MLKKCLLLFVPVILFSHQLPQEEKREEMPPITPAAGPLPNHQVDVVLDVEFLYWYATTTNLSYATKYVVTEQGNTLDPAARIISPEKIYEPSWSWNPGMRVGLGVVIDHDGWNIHADWTYTYNSTSNAQSVAPFPINNLTNQQNIAGTEALASPWFIEGTNINFTRISSIWSLLLHQIDLELGRKFWVSPHLALRPFGGLRGHWSRMFSNIRGIFEGSDLGNHPRLLQETARRTQDYWAVGFVGGLESAWHLARNWSIFIDWAFSLVYGPFDVQSRFRSAGVNTNNQVVSNFSVSFNHDDIYTLQPIYDLALGLRWELPIYDSAYRVCFDMGWENHLYPSFNHLDLNTSASDNGGTFLPAGGDLTLSGLVLRGRFEF
ncbi:MAG: hypothetical protein KDK76_06170 [Chlamydiia bacterium]|nr:hypothetical protein [Chlamydiia bacterium]